VNRIEPTVYIGHDLMRCGSSIKEDIALSWFYGRVMLHRGRP
jgi:hypothetical protein